MLMEILLNGDFEARDYKTGVTLMKVAEDQIDIKDIVGLQMRVKRNVEEKKVNVKSTIRSMRCSCISWIYWAGKRN